MNNSAEPKKRKFWWLIPTLLIVLVFSSLGVNYSLSRWDVLQKIVSREKTTTPKTGKNLAALVLGAMTHNPVSSGKILGDSISNLAQKLAYGFGDLLKLLPGQQPPESSSPTTQEQATGATVASSGGDQLTVANPILPSIQGFGTDKIVGASTVSYPIAVPAGTGGLTPSLSLSYSSRAVDDQHNDQLCWNTYFNNQSSLAGLGWDLGGLGYIARDPGQNKGSKIYNEYTDAANLEDDRYFLVFPGGATELINEAKYSTITPGSAAAGKWRTVPETFLKIKHSHLGGGRRSWDKDKKGYVNACETVPNVGYVGYDTDQWEITTKDGTTYYFGSPADMAQIYKGRFCNDDACSQIFATSTEQMNPDPTGAGDVLLNQNMDGGAIPDPNLATEYNLAQCTKHCVDGESSCSHFINRMVPQKWHLRKIVDTHGNTIEIRYEARVKSASRGEYDGEEATCPIETWGAPCPNFYTHEIRPVQVLYGKNVNVTGDTYKMKVDLNYESRNDYQTVSSYFGEDENDPVFKCRIDKDYDDGNLVTSFSKVRLSGVDVKVSDRLVRRYGLTYSYGDPGGLKQKDEGAFGGHSLLTDITQYGTNGTSSLPAYHFTYTGSGPQIYLQRADNGYSGAVEFSYTDVYPKVCQYKDAGADCEAEHFCADGSYGEVKHGINCFTGRGVIRKRLVNKRVYDGVGGNFKVEYAYSGSPAAAVQKHYPIVDDKECTNGAFTEFKLLGHEWMTETLYALNDDSVKVGKSKSYFYDKLAGGDGCFKSDPRSGAEWKTEALDPNNGDAVLTRSISTIKPDDLTYATVPDPHGWNYFIRTTRVDNTIGGKTSRVDNWYDKDAVESGGNPYGNGKYYGNLLQTHLWGEIDGSGNNVDPSDDRYQFTNYAYNITNWILDRPSESYLSADPAGTYKYGWTRNYFDSDANCTDSVQTSFSGTKGELKATIAKQDTMTPVSSAACDASPGENPGCVKASFTYDSYGNQTNAYGPRPDQRTETLYDDRYHLFPVESRTYLDASNFHKTSIKYDFEFENEAPLGLPRQITDVNDKTVNIQYDVFGRKWQVEGPSLGSGKSPETQFHYSVADSDWPYPNAGAPVSVLTQTWKDSSDIIKSVVHYNGLGQQIQSQSEWENGGFILTNTSYNSLGKTEEVSLPYAASRFEVGEDGLGRYRPPDWSKPHSNTTYDALGRVLVATNPDNTSSRSEYLNWTVTSFDAENLKSWLANDAFGKTKTVKAYNRNESEYATTSNTYDLTGNLIKTTDPSGNISFACYDSLGRKYESSDLDLGKSWSHVDVAGNLVWQKDAKNQEFNFQYDLLNRLERSNLPDGSYVVQTYDQGTNGLGRLKKTEKFLAGGTPHSSREVTGFDALGRSYGERFSFPSQLGSTSFTTEYLHYDLLNNLEQIQYPDGEQVNNTYDSLGRLKTVIGNDTYVSDITYYPQGEIKSLTLGDAKTTNYTYNANNRRLETMSAASVLDYSYTYDNVGNIKTWTGVASSPITFNYDQLYRLTSATGGLTANYDYDVLSRLTTKNENTNLSPTYDPNFPLHAPKNVSGTNYSYDNNGNLLTDGQRTITWNVENKPSSIVLGTTTTNYDYDAGGSRIYRETPQEKKIYVNQYFTKDLLAGTIEKYYYAGSKRIAQRTITAEPTPTPTPSCTVSCPEVRAYDNSWALITSWSTKVPPLTVNFAVEANTNCSGGITKARFKFASEGDGAWRETTTPLTARGTTCAPGNTCFTTPIALTAGGNYKIQVQVYNTAKGWQ